MSSGARIFSFARMEGLFLISYALDRFLVYLQVDILSYLLFLLLISKMQIEFCHDCLTRHCSPPNLTNISETPLEVLNHIEKGGWLQLFYKWPFCKDVDYEKLCWSTLGYHFDWNTRKYREVQNSVSQENGSHSHALSLADIFTRHLQLVL
jgi:hypothetical protein